VEPTADAPRVVVFPPLLFGGALVIGVLLHLVRPAPALPSLIARLLGLVMLVLGWLLARSAEAARPRRRCTPASRSS
jgi:hypothetical protein